MKYKNMLLAVPALLLISACGGGHDSTQAPASATSISYTDPARAAGEWALLKDASASTNKRLVLNLVGPTGSLFRGVGFNLKVDTGKVAFSKFRDDNGVALGYMLDKGVLHDLDESSQPMACVATAAGVKGNILSVGLWQKCLRYEIPPDNYAAQPLGSRVMNDAMDCSTNPVLQIALDLGKDAAPGDVLLAITKAAIIPNHGKSMDLPLKTTVRVGTLTLE